MICPTCGANNRDNAAFCRHCGRLLLSACPRCRAAAEPGANFCDSCGAPLSPRAWTGQITNDELRITNEEGGSAPLLPRPPAPLPPTTPAPLDLDRYIPRELLGKLTAARGASAERRVVTLLFCDIQGSTALAGQLDPEEWTEIVNGAFEQMVRPIYKYEGTVARLMGDGLLAFFGAPIAHEDDPRRAVLAGLSIVEGIRAYRAGLPPAAAELDVRVGINTGLVVVGAVGSDLRLEYSAIGDAINLAARMEQTAAPGTVQIAEDTYRLVAGQFEVEPLGPIAVKGKAAPVPAYRVLRRAGGGRRAATVARAPLVNRRMEWSALERAVAGLGAGRGGLVFLTGDAGLGKTRLIDEVAERLLPMLDPPARLFDAAAVSYETSQPYSTLIRLLRPPLGLLPGDPPERVRERLAAAVPPDDRALMETLFGVAAPDGHELSGEGFAAALDACLERSWRAQAAAGPLVLALDELQWLDASSAERLAALFHLTESAPVLFLCALRRERRSPGWSLLETAGRDLPHRLSEIALHPLNDGDSRQLLAGLLDGELPDALAALVLEKAEGNPLFLEEVVRHLIERGDLSRAAGGPWTAAPPAGVILPDSLQALITARIDRLDDAPRRVLQAAAVIGRHFARSPLAALVDDPDALDGHLRELQRMELVREVSRLPEATYSFSHTLTQEAVYHTILLKQRRAMHRRVAEVIEALAANEANSVAPVLAHHFMEGEAPERALPYLLLAAADALRLHATAEAIVLYERALPVALAAADSPALIAIATNRGRALELQSRFAEAKAFYESIEAEARARGDVALELEAVIAQGKLHSNVTPFYDAARGRALMERAVALAEAAGNRVAEVRILWNLLNIGRFDLNGLEWATVHGERGLALARELGLGEELAYLVNDLGELYGTFGRLDRAGELLGEARDRWRALGNEAMLADSLTSSAVWEQIGGHFRAGLVKVEEAFLITTRIGNIWGEAYSQAVRGQILGYLGEVGRAVDDLSGGNEKTRAAGFVAGDILSNTFLARVLQEAGDLDEALRRARAALTLAREQLPQFVGMCIGRIVNCLVARGEIDAAADLYADAAAYQEQQQVFQLFDLSLAGIELALAQGDVAEALARAEAAVTRFTAMDSRGILPPVYYLRARALLAAGRADEAAGSFAAAIDLARTLDMRGSLWRFLAAAAALAGQRGDDAAAATLHAEAAAEIAFVAANTWPDDLRASFLAQTEKPQISQISQI
ncbi:putative Adenylate/guanylate cyclase with TPR repeats [Candidatus Promineifilum breve]|uniref:Adenylate/guanylate cyclase with TPR repeats n=1 Tax=Candidatus Promineifilum breve TaxID=1806508 RepID=A0A161KBC9_9CHLR|nr:adenylate/guanylate cyclase domain-containing protein [Candidatus Promineifilum breve]CUS05833.1 putative Adenylate/guanylate cyclase with TPR repeats [Candidatus Promineifilum breve]